MEKKYSTFIFDLDGTLLDTLEDLTVAVNYTLEKYGFPLRTNAEVRAFVGNGVMKLMERAIGDCAVDVEQPLATFKKYYAENCTRYTKPYDGIMPLLQVMKEKGIKTAVVSNKADFAVKILAKEYFGDLIGISVGENEEKGVRKKPAPDSVLTVMEQLNAIPEETVYVGDSEVDIFTAKNAGVDCISVDWGFKDREFLVENGGDCILSTPMEIAKFCKE